MAPRSCFRPRSATSARTFSSSPTNIPRRGSSTPAGCGPRRTPKNVGSYFGYIDEAQYVAGIVAGHSTKTGKLGFVAAKPIPQLLRNVNAFMLGARLANPNATLQVIFTGDWSMPVKEAEATNSLVDAGVDVITWRLAGPCTFALGHLETPLQRVGAIARRHHANPAEAHWRWRGRGASRSGSVSVNTMHALFKGEVECKMTAGSTGSLRS